MGLPSNTNALQNGFAQGYQIGRSLRFRNSASAYLSRTFGSNGSQQTWTWSGWVKVGRFGSQQPLFCAYSNTTNYGLFTFSANAFINATDTLKFYTAVSNVGQAQLETAAVFRDPSAWYHILLQVDTTQATANNRVRIYVNGVQQTLTGTQPSQNTNLGFYNTTSVPQQIGALASGTYGYFDGYMAEINFIDGQSLSPSSFGLYDSNGIWQPKKYTGTYGTNGFYLPFSNTTSTTTLVADASGNGNNWTANNISLTAGTTYDSMLDSPTNSNVGGNYCVLNPLNAATTLSNANLNSNPPSANWLGTVGTLGFPSGKFYYEATITATTNTVFQIFGAARSTISNATIASNGYPGATADGWGVQLGTPSYKVNNGTFTALGSNYSYTTNDVIMVAVDVDAGKFWYGKNGTWIESGDPATGTNALFTNLTTTIIPMIGQNTSGNSCAVNFGQRPFSYTPPSGYNALNTANLPAATINYGAPYMNAVTYTGYGPLIPSGLGIPTKRNALNQNVSKSLRFRSSASAYLNRTFTTPTNNKIWTWSGWAKRGSTGSRQFLSSTNTTGGVNAFYFEYDSSDAINLGDYGASWTWRLMTTQVFKDPTAWHHIVLSVDTTQATASNRVKLYVNGVEVTAFSTATYPSQNSNPYWNSATYSNIGNLNGTSLYFDGYLAELNFIDGQQLTPSSFGETNSDGVWVPKSYTGTYGTNGFYLPFTNTTSTTTLVADSSGNGNNWTPNNISLTAGTTYDSMIDSPTDYASAGNYAVFNPLDKGAGITLSNANLTAYSNAQGPYIARSTIAVSSGKWYWEAVQTAQGSAATNNMVNGICPPSDSTTNIVGYTAGSYGYIDTGNKANNSVVTSYGATYGLNDIIGVALDLDNGTLTFYKNGVSQGVAFTGISGTFLFAVSDRGGGVSKEPTWAINFGQRPFTYSAPSGYSTLNTYNITAPSKTWFSSANNSGRGSATAYPDFVWIKSRSSAQNHSLNDTLRGPTLNLLSNSSNAEAGASTMFSVNKYGLTLGNDASVNSSSYTDVMWGWQAGQGTTSTNTSGTITSTVSASASSGFSVVTYTGTGANGTIGHGLGVAPSMIIIKNRQAANSWVVYHVSTGNGNVMLLNSTNASTADSTAWNTTTPTSSVFSVGSGAAADTNQTSGGGQHVAYCFAAVRGYSAFGSYTGNGSTDGPFVFTNFRPRWLMVKAATTAASWVVFDTSRSVNNVTGLYLCPNLSQTEAGPGVIDIDVLSNGFKLRNNDGAMNTANTYIYAAFAENPFSIARAR